VPLDGVTGFWRERERLREPSAAAVVFPEPDSPTIATHSPARTDSDASSRSSAWTRRSETVTRVVNEIGNLAFPVDGADISPGGVQLAPQRLGVLVDLGGDLRRLDIGIQRTDQHMDGLVGCPQVDLSFRGNELDKELEVEDPPLI
jgi:hypothetical protein